MAYSKIKGEAAVFVAAKQLSDNAPKLSEPIAKRLLGLLEEKDAGRHYVRFVAPQLKAILAAKPKENKPKEEKASPAGKSDYPFVLKNIEGKEVSLESFKGKVVYLDFWASWCGPCRQMFPFSKQLHEKLSDKQKKQIAFVYISIDGTPEAWKTALEQLDLSNGINLHSPGNWQSEVVKYFQINSIPRYMIFDKKGILVDSNAKRPADPALLDDLLKLTE
jgi:thiol-disulfide isomerase/thioredoxin